MKHQLGAGKQEAGSGRRRRGKIAGISEGVGMFDPAS